MPRRLDQRGGRCYRRYAQGLRRFRARSSRCRRDYRSGFERGVGQRRHCAWAEVAATRHVDYGRRYHRGADRERCQRQHRTGCLLRVDVRLPVAVGPVALCAARCACSGASDLDGRPRRRCTRCELHRAGFDDRRARHRSPRQIHLRHGRNRRSAGVGAQCGAVGRTARAIGSGIAIDQSGDHGRGCGCAAKFRHGRRCARRRAGRPQAGSGSLCQRGRGCVADFGQADQDGRGIGANG